MALPSCIQTGSEEERRYRDLQMEILNLKFQIVERRTNPIVRVKGGDVKKIDSPVSYVYEFTEEIPGVTLPIKMNTQVPPGTDPIAYLFNQAFEIRGKYGADAFYFYSSGDRCEGDLYIGRNVKEVIEVPFRKSYTWNQFGDNEYDAKLLGQKLKVKEKELLEIEQRCLDDKNISWDPVCADGGQ